MMKDERFEIVYKQRVGFGSVVKVLRDKETGICYLYHMDGYSGGLTALLDRNGNPVVTSGFYDPKQ